MNDNTLTLYLVSDVELWTNVVRWPLSFQKTFHYFDDV